MQKDQGKRLTTSVSVCISRRGMQSSVMILHAKLKILDGFRPIRRVWLFCFWGLLSCRKACNACVVLGMQRIVSCIMLKQDLAIVCLICKMLDLLPESLNLVHSMSPHSLLWRAMSPSNLREIFSAALRTRFHPYDLYSRVPQIDWWAEIIAVMLLKYSATHGKKEGHLSYYFWFVLMPQIFSWSQQSAFYRWIVFWILLMFTMNYVLTTSNNSRKCITFLHENQA